MRCGLAGEGTMADHTANPSCGGLIGPDRLQASGVWLGCGSARSVPGFAPGFPTAAHGA